jgi:hypothetical protein
MMGSILRNRAAVVGVPAMLFGCALIVGVASALSGFSHPAPFVFLCFLAGASLLLAGFTTVNGFSRVSRSRRVELALGTTYIGVGLVTLVAGLIFYGLMTMCVVCI